MLSRQLLPTLRSPWHSSNSRRSSNRSKPIRLRYQGRPRRSLILGPPSGLQTPPSWELLSHAPPSYPVLIGGRPWSTAGGSQRQLELTPLVSGVGSRNWGHSNRRLLLTGRAAGVEAWMDTNVTMGQLTRRASGPVWIRKPGAPKHLRLPRGATLSPLRRPWRSTRRRVQITGLGRRWLWVVVQGVRGRGSNLWGPLGCLPKVRPLHLCHLTPHYHTPPPLSPPLFGENAAPKNQKNREGLCTRTFFLWEDVAEGGTGRGIRREGGAATRPLSLCRCLFHSPPPTPHPPRHRPSRTRPPPAPPLPPAHPPLPPPLPPAQPLRPLRRLGPRRAGRTASKGRTTTIWRS